MRGTPTIAQQLFCTARSETLNHPFTYALVLTQLQALVKAEDQDLFCLSLRSLHRLWLIILKAGLETSKVHIRVSSGFLQSFRNGCGDWER